MTITSGQLYLIYCDLADFRAPNFEHLTSLRIIDVIDPSIHTAHILLDIIVVVPLLNLINIYTDSPARETYDFMGSAFMDILESFRRMEEVEVRGVGAEPARPAILPK